MLAAFDRHPIVALGMQHLQQDEADVVECGNPLYQGILDRFIAGQTVELERL